jgi:alcohol dehydrogenase
MISANRGLLAFNLIWLWGEVQRLPAAMHATLELIPDPPLIGLERAFDDAPAAMRALQSGATTGKVILHC